MAENTSGMGGPPDPPHPSLQTLDPLVGNWTVSGPEIDGHVRFEWLEGGYFLVQHVDLGQGDEPERGVEYIGYDGEAGELRSHYFGKGPILEYTWEVDGDTLTIWFGGKDSPAFFKGQFDAERTECRGGWEWPGGGYESNMKRAS